MVGIPVGSVPNDFKPNGSCNSICLPNQSGLMGLIAKMGEVLWAALIILITQVKLTQSCESYVTLLILANILTNAWSA